MESISRYEFATLEFLLRNFSSRYTVRQIAIKIKASPAGIHKGLRKLEEDSIVKSEKFGTGLFYYINLENQMAKHISAFVLLMQPEQNKELEKIKPEIRAAIQNKNSLLVISHSNIKEMLPKEFTSTIIDEHEFVERIKKRDKEILEFIKEGKILWGENIIVSAIHQGMFRF